MVDAVHVQAQRYPERDHVPEGMKKWQDAEDDVRAPQLHDVVHRFDIGAKIVKGEDHAFGIARGTGSENHGQLVIALQRVQAEHAVEQRGGHGVGHRHRGQFVSDGQTLAQIFQQNDLGIDFQPEFFHHLATGQNMTNARFMDAPVEDIVRRSCS